MNKHVPRLARNEKINQIKGLLSGKISPRELAPPQEYIWYCSDGYYKGFLTKGKGMSKAEFNTHQESLHPESKHIIFTFHECYDPITETHG